MPRHKFDLAAAMAATETHTQAATELTLQELAYAYQAARCDDSDTRIRKWLPPFGLRSAWTIQTAEIEHAATAMLKSGFKPSSVNRDLSLIGSLYKWAIAQRLAPSGFISPTRAIRRYAEDIRRVELAPHKLTALRDRARATRDRRFPVFVELLLDTGARKSELLRRRWADIDLDNQTILCQTTKTGIPRVLHFRPETAALIRRVWPRNGNPEALIFEGKRRDQPANFRRLWTKTRTEVGLPDFHLHDIRHVAAAQLLRAGISATVAGQTLGNSSQILVRRYGHLETADMRAAQVRRWEASK